MADSNLESLFWHPLILIDDIKIEAYEVDSYKSECDGLCSRAKALDDLLQTALCMVRQGNTRFCDGPTVCILEDAIRTLEKCSLLLRKCKEGGIWKRIITITSLTDFKKALASMDDSIANVKWLLESVMDEELVSVIGMPPITSAYPSLSFIWSLLSKLQGGTPELREAAASDLASMAAASEQNSKLIIKEGGVPQLLKVLHDGTGEARAMAATALGNLAFDQEWVRKIVHLGAIPACVRGLEEGTLQVKAKLAWALTKMMETDPEVRIELGEATAVQQFVALMFESDEKLSMAASSKVTYLQVPVNANVSSPEGATTSENIASPMSGGYNDGALRTIDEGEDLNENSQHSRGEIFHGFTSNDMDKDSEFKHDLKVHVTKALWLLAENNLTNSRRLAETRGLLGLAKLMEIEKGEVQKHAIKAILELAAVAEMDTEFRKFAFKLTSPSAKLALNQLRRLILDESIDPDLQVCCIKAVGSLARSFSTKDNTMIKALVSKLSSSDKRLHVIEEALNSLLKFTSQENYLCKEHSVSILEVPGLPFVVQLVVMDAKKRVQVPASRLLSRLAFNVGRTHGEAFQEAAALSVLKSVATSAAIDFSVEVPQEDRVLEAINQLEFFQAGKNIMHPPHVQWSKNDRF